MVSYIILNKSVELSTSENNSYILRRPKYDLWCVLYVDSLGVRDGKLVLNILLSTDAPLLYVFNCSLSVPHLIPPTVSVYGYDTLSLLPLLIAKPICEVLKFVQVNGF